MDVALDLATTQPLWLHIVMRFLAAVGMALVPLVTAIFLIWESRKVIARMQDRLGPTRAGTYAGPFALLQPVADTIKILTKELVVPEGADRAVFIAAPVIVVAVAIAVWAVIPLGPRGMQFVDLDVGAFYVVAMSSLTPFPIMMAGWSSRDKYADAGALRAVSRIISYRIPQILSLLVPVLLTGSLSLQDMIRAQQIPYIISVPLAAFIYIVAGTAELGRLPSELAEAESDIVAGYCTEYSGVMFGSFYLAGFISSFTASIFFSILFLGGWRGPWVMQVPVLGALWLFLKAFLVFNGLILFWAAMPRLRIDQVVGFNWKFMVPLGLVVLLVVALVDKVVAFAGVTSPWVRSAALFGANVVLGLGLAGVLRWLELHRHHAQTRRRTEALQS